MRERSNLMQVRIQVWVERRRSPRSAAVPSRPLAVEQLEPRTVFSGLPFSADSHLTPPANAPQAVSAELYFARPRNADDDAEGEANRSPVQTPPIGEGEVVTGNPPPVAIDTPPTTIGETGGGTTPPASTLTPVVTPPVASTPAPEITPAPATPVTPRLAPQPTSTFDSVPISSLTAITFSSSSTERERGFDNSDLRPFASTGQGQLPTPELARPSSESRLLSSASDVPDGTIASRQSYESAFAREGGLIVLDSLSPLADRQQRKTTSAASLLSRSSLSLRRANDDLSISPELLRDLTRPAEQARSFDFHRRASRAEDVHTRAQAIAELAGRSEGGLIELPALSHTNTVHRSGYAVESIAAVQDASSEIGLDVGVGLYRAVELAAIPAEGAAMHAAPPVPNSPLPSDSPSVVDSAWNVVKAFLPTTGGE